MPRPGERPATRRAVLRAAGAGLFGGISGAGLLGAVSGCAAAQPAPSTTPTASTSSTAAGPSSSPSVRAFRPAPFAPASTSVARTQTAPTPGATTTTTGTTTTGPVSSPSPVPLQLPALPAAETRGRRVAVVLSPHPDDETLSMGVWIADAVARGDRVILVCLTDGRSTGALPTIERRLGRTVDRDEVAAARLRELRAAAQRLGIAEDDVVTTHLDLDDSPGGSRLTADEAYTVVATLAERFPRATYLTMSPVAERHPDHIDAGLGLQAALDRGVVTDVLFAISRLWWSLPSPTPTEVVPSSLTAAEQVRAAAGEYALWQPQDGRWAVGTTSVEHQFQALRGDLRDRVYRGVANPAR